MTSAPLVRLGPLGRRLLAAFVLVALASVAVLTVAALVGTARGLDAGRVEQRQAAADSAARAAATAYASAGSWGAADLGPVAAVAQAADAEWTVRDAEESVVATSSEMGSGAMNGMGRGGVSSDIVVDGVIVGSVRLGFGSPGSSQAQTIAWTWILVAAAAALVVATVVAAFTTRWLTAPIVRLSATARAFAAGDRSARPAPEDVAAANELGDLARAFDAAAADVGRSETTRRRLSADVAHELRTPLAALQAGLEELQDGLVAPTTEHLGALHDQAVRLGRLVEDLATLSAAETAAFSLRRQEVDLGSVVADAVAAARPAFTARDIAIDADVRGAPVALVADADRLHQAIGNLLSNAARYCRPGDHVQVTAVAGPGHVVIAVSDTGPGIPPDELPYVFDRMWRGSSGTSAAGSGIGLAVTRELVQAHGGSVSATSDGRSGTTFTITLPRPT